MPIRRRSTPRPVLRHVAFVEAMAAHTDGDAGHDAAHVTFLVLRLLDHRIAFGPQVTASASPELASVRDELAQRVIDAELRAVLSTLVDAIAETPDDAGQAALSPLFTLGTVLGARGRHAQAGDVFLTVARLTDAAAQPDLAYESEMRAGTCLLTSGDREWADKAFLRAGQLALRQRDRQRQLLAKLGRAKVLWARGDHAAADGSIAELIAEAEEEQSAALTSRLLHERATLAWLRDDHELAVRSAFRAFDIAPQGQDRDMILTALAAYLEALDAPDAAQVARGAIDHHRLAQSRPVPRSLEAERTLAIELAREIARALRDHRVGGTDA